MLTSKTLLWFSYVVLTSGAGVAAPELAHAIDLAVRLPPEARGHQVERVAIYGPDDALIKELEMPFAAGVARAPGEVSTGMLEDGFELVLSVQLSSDALARYGDNAKLRAVFSTVGSSAREEFHFTIGDDDSQWPALVTPPSTSTSASVEAATASAP